MTLPQEAAEVLARFARNIKAGPSLHDDERFDAFIVHCYEHDIPATAWDVREFLRKSAIGQRTDAKQIINMYVTRYEPGRALLAFYDRQPAAGKPHTAGGTGRLREGLEGEHQGVQAPQQRPAWSRRAYASA